MAGQEAEKLISMSLCKMASSRGFRRGGSSLHKHLLIASVLTKARSAFFENWYMNDDDEDEGAGSSAEEDSIDSSSPETSDDSIDEDDMGMNNNRIVDPALFVESEIELPADILSCVEKLGSLGEMDFLHNNLSASVGQSEEDMEASMERQEESTAAELYLELAAAAAPAIVNNIDSDSDISLRNDDVTEDGLRVLSENSKASSATTTTSSNLSYGSGRLNFKRRRVSESESIPVAEKDADSADDLPALKDNDLVNAAKRIRTNEMAVGEVFSEDKKETDHFLGDGLDQASTEEMRVNKDRRVPCTSSSSNSSSDEEFEESMEVDQITSLVQYFSFTHQHEGLAKGAPTNTPATTNSSTASTATKATKSSSNASAGLIRSVSSPDLCRELSNPPPRCLVVTT